MRMSTIVAALAFAAAIPVAAYWLVRGRHPGGSGPGDRR